ncbi:hypothetical protein [Mesorhizobium sp. ANAO-SY3R2]|uniref:hypothetical protein n=1 Tax=Mesorhizobium sp. ANAO-SY3R2 TaxID=3166644 RepID=UPI003670F230
MLAHLFFLLFSAFAVLTASVASGLAQQGMADAQAQLAQGNSAACYDNLLVFLAEDDHRLALAECDGDDGPPIQFRHDLPTEAINAAGSPVPSSFNLLRARTSAPRAPPVQV